MDRKSIVQHESVHNFTQMCLLSSQSKPTLAISSCPTRSDRSSSRCLISIKCWHCISYTSLAYRRRVDNKEIESFSPESIFTFYQHFSHWQSSMPNMGTFLYITFVALEMNNAFCILASSILLKVCRKSNREARYLEWNITD